MSILEGLTMDGDFCIKLKAPFNGHKKGTVLAGVHVERDKHGKIFYRRDVAQENFPVSVVEELDE